VPWTQKIKLSALARGFRPAGDAGDGIAEIVERALAPYVDLRIWR